MSEARSGADTGADDAGALWRFALNRYARIGVAELCLELQDRWAVDVCTALFCLWRAQAGVPVGRDLLGTLDDGDPGRWRREVVLPLRAARRAMKAAPEILPRELVEVERARVKGAELAAEKFEMELLCAYAPAAVGEGRPADAASRRLVAAASMLAYLGMLGAAADAEAVELSSRLVSSCVD